jgi:hypothetical protein
MNDLMLQMKATSYLKLWGAGNAGPGVVEGLLLPYRMPAARIATAAREKRAARLWQSGFKRLEPTG